jgi:hypothetical protein
VPEYEVTFINSDGTVLDKQLIAEGNSAEAPALIEREGYTFLRWDKPFTNVKQNLTVKAEDRKNKYTVVFVDWENNDLRIETYEHGDILNPPVIANSQGKKFTGWNGTSENEALAVTGNMVLTAQYDAIYYTVKFMYGIGSEANVISEQSVAYGAAATPPPGPQVEGKVFLGWSTDSEWWNVQGDLVVYPLLAYPETVMAPLSNLAPVSFGVMDWLELQAEEGATIYYALESYDPENIIETGIMEFNEYTEPLVLEETTTVRAYASMEGKNNSDIIVVDFIYDPVSYETFPTDIIPVGEYNVLAEAGKTITLDVKIENNPGLSGYLFYVEADRSVFTVEYDEERADFTVEQGDFSNQGTLFTNLFGDLGWQILWFNPVPVSGDGSLFRVTLSVGDEVPTGIYPIRVGYSASNTLTTDYEEVTLHDVGVTVSSTSSILIGDVNGDGDITNADVVRLARYIVGLSSIEEKYLFAADINGDGYITNADVVLLARYVIGLYEINQGHQP